MNAKTTVEILKYRGFLIEEKDDGVYVSKNMSEKDKKDLEHLLIEKNLGCISGNKVIITSLNENQLLDMFSEVKSGPVSRGIGGSSNNRVQSWKKINRRFCADRVEVLVLEPYIARYIISLSAIGIYTGGCCDGNHPDKDKMYIEFDGPIYSDIHRVFWEKYLKKMFNINWDKTYSQISLREDPQKQYDELNKAAEYIYENRLFFRKVRMESSNWINKRSIKRYSFEEKREKIIKTIEEAIEYNELQ